MFLTEKELRIAFWQNYNYNGRAIRYQFECPLRTGNADLLTVEMYQGEYQLNSFEFKLEDIKKALLQAKGNLPYVNKSWIVVPSEKKELIETKYLTYLRENKIGAICVTEGGKWEMVVKPFFQDEVRLNQNIFKLLLLDI